MIERCKWCGSTNIKFEETPESIHYGRQNCGHCKKFVSWVKNPNVQRNTNRISKKRVKEVSQFHGFKKEFCFICLRTKSQLGWSETLTVDHIQELDKGGKDTIENMQVLCSACHKLKNWARLYVNWHFNKEEEDGYKANN